MQHGLGFLAALCQSLIFNSVLTYRYWYIKQKTLIWSLEEFT